MTKRQKKNLLRPPNKAASVYQELLDAVEVEIRAGLECPKYPQWWRWLLKFQADLMWMITDDA